MARTLSYTLYHFSGSSPESTAVVTAATLTLTPAAGGSAIVNAATATVSPAGASASHVLSYTVSGSVAAGNYTALWHWSESGEGTPRTASFVVVVSDDGSDPIDSAILAIVRQSLTGDPDSDDPALTADKLRFYLSDEKDALRLSEPCCFTDPATGVFGDTLTITSDADLRAWEQAAGLMIAAAYVQSPAGLQFARTVTVKAGPVTETGGALTPADAAAVLMLARNMALNRISCVRIRRAKAAAAMQSASFGTAGHSQSRGRFVGCGCYGTGSGRGRFGRY